MAITRASLDAVADNTDATQYQSTSITPTANRLVIAVYDHANLTESVDPTVPTVTGNGLTWTVVDSFVWRTGGDRYRLCIAAADSGGSPSAGVVTFNHGSQTQEGAHWSIFELNGTDVANGVAQSFVQFVHSDIASGTACPITLAAQSSADNRPFFAVGKLNNQATTANTSWTEIHEVNITSAPVAGLETQERLDAFDTSANATWTSITGRGGIAFEVKATGAGGGAAAVDPFGMSGFFGG